MEEAQSLNALDEKEIIKALGSKFKLEAGSSGFAMSIPWLKSWKNYVGYDSDKVMNGTRPGPIDNTNFTTGACKISEKSILGVDFEVVSEETWETFYIWYGGGPVIETEVAFDPNRNKNVPVLEYPKYKLFYGNDSKVIQISKYKTIGDLLSIASNEFNIETELFNIRDFSNHVKGEVYQREKIICQYQVIDGQELLIELCEVEKKKSPHKHGLYNSQKTMSVRDLKEFVKGDSLQHLTKKNEESHLTKSVSCENLLEKFKIIPGTSGLQNLGDTSYMNSVLQCVFHIPSLQHIFETNEWKEYPNNGTILEPFVSLLRSVWSGKTANCNPQEFKDAVDDNLVEFRDLETHDAHTFITMLLKNIHDSMNHATGRPAGVSNTLDSMRAWNAIKQTDDSPIIDTFFGLCRNSKCCSLCGDRKLLFEPYMSLQLPLPQRRVAIIPFIFVPADPNEPMKSIKLKLFEDSSLEEFDECLSLEMKRKISLAFAEVQKSNHKIVWLPNYQPPRPGTDIYAFEISDHWILHAVVWLCIKVKKGLTKNLIEMRVPYVIRIPGPTTNADQLLEICDEYFSFLWDKSAESPTFTDADLPDDLLLLREKLVSFRKHTPRRFKIKLERSRFSKSMRFKSHEKAPWIARRNVFAVLNSDLIGKKVFNWSMIRRPIKASSIVPVNRSFVLLSQCFNIFTEEAIVDPNDQWYCNYCEKYVVPKSQTVLWKLPRVMIIQLKRFDSDAARTKNDTLVKYPLIIDMREFFAGPGYGGRYRLVGVCEHEGTYDNGHYQAKCFVEGPDKWFLFSDTSVKEISDQTVVSPNAYILFYQRIE